MPVIVTPPTPYPEVNALLRELLANVQAILGPRLVGLYLFGSLANGDFDQHSDIDVVAVTAGDLADDLFAALQAMHARLAALDSPWATQLELSYIPQAALRRYDPAHAVHPHIDRGQGESLRLMQHGIGWLVQRHTLRQRGIALTGPAAQTLIDPVSPGDLQQAMGPILHEWAAELLADPTLVNSRGYQSYIVLSLCRILYTRQHGAIISKPAAVQWAQQNLPERWRPLIERAWLGRQQPDLKAQPPDVSETLDFIRYALEYGRDA